MLYPLVIIVLTTILYIIPLLILLPFKLSPVQKLLLLALTFFFSLFFKPIWVIQEFLLSFWR